MSKAEKQLAKEIHQDQGFSSPGQAAVIGLLLTADVVRRRFEDVISNAADITQQQYNVLRILRGAGENGLPTLDVAERMIEHSPGMTRMMDRLAKKGLITRERSAEDRRQVRCYLTDEGKRVLASLDDCVNALDQSIGEQLSEKKVGKFLGYLQSLRELP